MINHLHLRSSTWFCIKLLAKSNTDDRWALCSEWRRRMNAPGGLFAYISSMQTPASRPVTMGSRRSLTWASGARSLSFPSGRDSIYGLEGAQRTPLRIAQKTIRRLVVHSKKPHTASFRMRRTRSGWRSRGRGTGYQRKALVGAKLAAMRMRASCRQISAS